MAVTTARSTFSPTNRLLPLITADGRRGFQITPWSLSVGKVAGAAAVVFVGAGAGVVATGATGVATVVADGEDLISAGAVSTAASLAETVRCLCQPRSTMDVPVAKTIATSGGITNNGQRGAGVCVATRSGSLVGAGVVGVGV